MWKRNASNPLALFVALLLFAAGCSSADKVATPTYPPLLPDKGQSWQLVAMRGRTVGNDDKTPSLVVNPEAGTLSGVAYCNTYVYFVTLRLEAQHPDGDYYSIHLKHEAGGSLLCTEAAMNADARFLALLDKATRMRLTATTLTLFQNDKEILLFELQ